MKHSDDQAGTARLAAKLIGKILRAAGTQTLLREVAREMIGEWAKKGPIRRRIAAPARWAVSKMFRPGRDSDAGGIASDAGTLITAMAREINESRAGASAPANGAPGKAIHDFLTHTDFGEIRETAEGADPFVIALVQAFNEQLWKYPAKVAALVATVIPILNTSVRALRELLAPIEQGVGPDLLADILLSVVKGIDGKDGARLANSLQEALRRVHTGSLLLGRGGRPLFQIYLTDLLGDFLAGVDPALLKKARIALAEDREAVAGSLADALSSSPGITLAFLSSLGQVKSSGMRRKARRLGAMENLDGESLTAAVSESMSDFDTFEAAELVNALCRVANLLHEARPDLVSTLVTGIADSVSLDEIGETARWLIPDLVEAVRPVLLEVMPVLAEAFAGVAGPSYERAAGQAKGWTAGGES